MEIVGYSEPWTVAPGATISFFVSSQSPSYRAEMVRLIHGNTDPAGPGFKEERVPSSADGDYAGRPQGFEQGSYVEVLPSRSALELPADFTVQGWVMPTSLGGHDQNLLFLGCGEELSVRLYLDPDGHLCWSVRQTRLRSRVPLPEFRWAFVAAVCSASSRRLSMTIEWVDGWSAASTAEAAGCALPDGCVTDSVVLGAEVAGIKISDQFNGCLDSPRIFGEALGPDQLSLLAHGRAPESVSSRLLAAWNFGADVETRRVRDLTGNGFDAVVRNLGRRGIPGHNWSGRSVSFVSAPEEFGAVFLHEEDMEDAGWETAFQVVIPDGLRSGIYAMRLRCEDGSEDHVPFYVTPGLDGPTQTVALLVPTFSYLAYGNDHSTWRNPAVPPPPGAVDHLCIEDRYALNHRLKGLYDWFDDETGCSFASRLRPMVNMRPRYRLAVTTLPHQLPADLHVVDWLDHLGIDYDVITDEEVHRGPPGLLSRYRVVLSGHHPEYTTEKMWTEIDAFSRGGGRFMYIGGNGFYWVISTDPEAEHVIEIRRGQRGTGTWRGREGEGFHQTTGEPGGLWRDRGRAPQRLVGIGMAAQGTGPAQPYRRLPDGQDPRAAFVFEGVGDDEPIGDFGLLLGAAGGVEVDRFDHHLGTPPHALLLATTETFTDEYQHVVEEVESSDSKQGGSQCPHVRGDLTFYETPNGGAVFSVGSMCWVGSLSWDDYHNNVSRITENVLRRFMSSQPFEMPD